jgi:PAS domain S-box-containing protein
LPDKIRVLLVEDLPSDAELAKYEIKQVIPDCVFELVDNKINFQKALDEYNPDVIVSDYSMPNFDGLTALKLTLEKTDLIPFILFTGSINENTAVDCMKIGAADYIIKEHIKRLGQSVKNALEQRDEMIIKRKAIDKAAQYSSDQELLLNTASQLLKSTNLNQIYQIVFEVMQKLEKNSYLILTSIDPEEKIVKIILHNGFEKFYDWIGKIFKFDPASFNFPASKFTEKEIEQHVSGKLYMHPEGLFSLTAGTLSREISYLIEKTLNVKESYYIGFCSNGILYGGLSILKKDKGIPEKANIIELIFQQASQAIQKYYALQSAIQNQEKLQSLLDISQYSTDSIQDLLDKALEEVVKLTNSKIGYIYHYYEDRNEFVLNTWSKNVMKDCNIQAPKTIYQIEKTGIWGEAVRQRKPIIVNKYSASNPFKKGYPKGHVILNNFLTIPVFYNDSIVAVAGVANKESDYNQVDVDEVTLMMDTVWKIVRQKESDQLILENEEKYRAIITQSNNNIYLADIDTLQIIEANPALCNCLGYNEEELIRLKAYDIADYPKESVFGLMETLKEKKRMYFGERNYKKKNGDLVFVEANASILNYRNKKVACVISYDITERKKSDLALFQSREKLKMILNNSPIGMASIDEFGSLTGSNNSFKEIFCIPLTVEPSKFNIFDEKFLTKIEKETLCSIQVLRSEKTFSAEDLELVLKTKIYRTGKLELEISIKAVPLDPNSLKFEYVLQIQDITERKKAEEAREDFINSISHEMRTPLTAMRESTIIMKEHFSDNLLEEQKTLLDVSIRNIDRLGNLIQNVLDIQNFDNSVMELNKKSESINNIIEELVKNIGIQFNNQDLKLVLELESSLPSVFIDKDRIIQVLSNLISNAVKFTSKGSITIRTEYEKHDNHIKVSVIDTGIGISRENMGKIFTPFSQIKNNYEFNVKGTGLGLPISKKILNGHDSDLYVISEDGLAKDRLIISKLNTGSTFYFYLPPIKD